MALPVLIARLGLPVLVSVLSGALGKVNAPAAQNAARALEHLEAALAGGLIPPEQMAEANRHAEAVAALKAREYEQAMAEINQSLRAEAASDDPYVRRMRPTFGYLMAVTWAAQMTGLAYVLIFQTEKAPAVLAGMEALSTIWAVGLSVLGIYVYKRSEEKKIFPGIFAQALTAPQAGKEYAPALAAMATPAAMTPAAGESPDMHPAASRGAAGVSADYPSAPLPPAKPHPPHPPHSPRVNE